ncbi:MAG: histidine kinase [bacterium]
MIIPVLKNKKSIITYSSIWMALLLCHIGIIIIVLKQDIEYAAVDGLVFNAIYFLLGTTLWFPCQYISFENNSPLKIFLGHSIAAIFTSGLWVYIGQLLVVSVFPDKRELIVSTLVWRLIIGLLFYIVMVAVYYVIIYYNNFKDKLTHESKLNTLVKEAELRSLKYQINPHFIFNSLNSISSLTLSNPDKAREMTIKLSSFMRGTLSKNENQMSKLGDEIENVKLYLEIEKVRFEDKFDFVENIHEDCSKAVVPAMLLQPLFENAIKHGVYESTEKVTISISCKPDNNYLKITVENNFDPDAVSKRGERIGLKNIETRLELIYNEAGLLKTKKENNIFTATVLIPINKK